MRHSVYAIYASIVIVFLLIYLIYLHIYARQIVSYEMFSNNSGDIHIFQKFHHGDCMFTCVYLQSIIDFINNSPRKIYFYINRDYIKQMQEFISSPNIILKPLEEKPDDAYDIWIGHHFNQENKGNFNEVLVLTHNVFAEKFNFPKMKEFTYEDPDLLERYERLNDTCKNVDILIINSEPKSGQYVYNKNEWDALVRRLHRKYKIVTTLKVDNIPCTRDYDYSLKDIAAISTHAKYMICVNTGPIVACFNAYTLKNVIRIFVFDINNRYSYPNVTHVSNISDLDAHFPI